MPLVYRAISPVKLSAKKLELNKNDSEFVAVNNGTLVNVLRQLASLVAHANDIFSDVALLTEQVGKRVRSVKLRLDELEVKAELYDPKLVPVPEGDLNETSIPSRIREVVLDSDLFSRVSQPYFLILLYDKAGKHQPSFPPRSPITEAARRSSAERTHSTDGRRPASFAALRDWKLDDFLDEKIAKLNARKLPSAEEVNRTVSSTFPSQVVQVDVTGRGFDRMKANRRSLVIHTKKVRVKRRRNTICGSMPNKECGIQTSFSSVASPTDNNKKYGIDSGHWSSCTSSAQGGVEAPSSSSAPSPWDPNSLSTSSDFLFDDEDRSLTPQLENFTDGLVSDSDSVDTEGYFTSFRNECGFPKIKKVGKDKNDKIPSTITENEYELFGKGSTSTTASSCGTVVMRNKPEPPARTSSVENLLDKKSQQHEDAGWEERVKRKSLIERVPSLVVVTPSPSCSSGSPPPLKDPGLVLEHDDSDSGRHTPRAEFSNDSESCTLSDTDSDRPEVKLSDIPRPSSTNSTASSSNSTRTLTNCAPANLPQPDVIPDVQVIRTMTAPKLDIGREYFALDTVLLGSSEEEHHDDGSSSEVKMNLSPAVSSKVRGARVVLDANGEIIFSSETLRRKRRHKVSFDPGEAVKPQEYDSRSNYSRIRESVYERIRKDTNEKLYECIEEIRKHNMKQSDASLYEKANMCSSPNNNSVTNEDHYKNNLSRISPGPRDHAKVSILLETDLDSAIPPVMPELKNLPKIKDRLKRNESYRIATDEIPPRPPLHSLNNKRMSLPQHNRKRDIPEEDPVFIQQILNISSSTNCSSARSPTESLNRITLSKFALSPDDRPSFLRRESPPTMDDISKEIYRFRKKFNIQPNATTTTTTSTTTSSSSSSSAAISNPPVISSTALKTPSPKQFMHTLLPPFPSIMRRKPPLTSTPISNASSSASSPSPFDPNRAPNARSHHFLPSPSTQSVSSRGKSTPSSLSKTSSARFFGLRPFPSMNSSVTASSETAKPSSLTSPSPNQSQSHRSTSRLGGSVTSLGDFKRLLQATQRKRSSISAVEVLKPKIGLETTI